MTWTPKTVQVTRWALRCDGQTTHGLCEQVVCHNSDDETGTEPGSESETALWAEPVLDRHQEDALDWDGWLVLRDGRVLCPEHVAACEYQVRASLEGLPFSDTHPDAESGRHVEPNVETDVEADVDASRGTRGPGGRGQEAGS